MSLLYTSSKDFQPRGDGEFDDRLPDEGHYILELTGVRPTETKENPWKPGTERTSIPLEWTIVSDVQGDTEYAGINFLNWYTYSLHELANLTPFVLALRGGEPFLTKKDRLPGESDEAFERRAAVEITHSIGKRIVAGLSHVKKKNTDWQEGEPMTLRTHRCVLDSPKPLKKKQRPANPEPLPQSLQPQRRPAPRPRQPEPEAYVEEFQIPAGYDDDAA